MKASSRGGLIGFGGEQPAADVQIAAATQEHDDARMVRQPEGFPARLRHEVRFGRTSVAERKVLQQGVLATLAARQANERLGPKSKAASAVLEDTSAAHTFSRRPEFGKIESGVGRTESD